MCHSETLLLPEHDHLPYMRNSCSVHASQLRRLVCLLGILVVKKLESTESNYKGRCTSTKYGSTSDMEGRLASTRLVGAFEARNVDVTKLGRLMQASIIPYTLFFLEYFERILYYD